MKKKAGKSMRYKLDGEWWTVRIGRPPGKEALDGVCVYKKNEIWLHPRAVRGDLLGIVVHEIAHSVLPPIDETHIRDLERIVCVVVRWAARNHCDGKISIGRHRRDRL